jgi:hypothetical protein
MPNGDAPSALRPEEADHRRRLAAALGDACELGALLGRGGFAEVYAARDTRLERDVAVKTLRYDLGVTSALLERFQREARAMAQLRHPNIIPIYSVGEGEGLAYFMMPLVRGETLREHLDRRRRLPIPEARRLILEIADALEHAHRAGMVHRDIKPDNVMLEGDEGRALVMDLGIAKAAAEDAAELTGTGMIIGTPHYMSPEQASGERTIDQRSDLYSLGVVAFEMLTGKLPFEAPTVQGVIVKHISEEAPVVGSLRPDCPPELARAVGRCLAKEPGERFASAAELIAFLTGEAPATRVSLATVAAPADPVRRFRLYVAGWAVLSLAAFGTDLAWNGMLDVAPLLMVLAAVPLLVSYQQLWREGLGWRDVLPGTAPPHESRAGSGAVSSGGRPTSGESAELGPYAEAVHRVRSERAVLVGLVERMPRSERANLGDVVSAADQLVARARAVARQLARLDHVIAESGERLATGGAGASRRGLDEAEARRGALDDELAGAQSALEELRAVVERVSVMGVAEVRTELTVALETVQRCARGRGARGDAHG